MPCPHFSIKISSRSKHAVVAQAAYQSGERLFDERNNRTRSYTEKKGIVYTEILLPPNAPEEYLDRNTLWNAVDKSEKNWNSQMARRMEIALPVELPMEKNVELIREYCQEQFVSKGMIADIAIHDPDRPDPNPHAHVMLTMRAMDEKGNWLPKSRREYELDENGSRIKDSNGEWKFHKVFTTDWDNRENGELWRSAWETIQNRYLEEAGRPERVHMKSYERQGIDRIPTVHMGPSVTAMERRGIQTDIGNLNREIKAVNVIVELIVTVIQLILSWLVDIREALKDLDIDPKEVKLVSLMQHRNREMRIKTERPYEFEQIIDYMKSNRISTMEDLERKIIEVGSIEEPIHRQMKEVEQKIKTVKKLLDLGDKRDRLTPVHDQYIRIHWKARKEKYREDHKDQLKEWNQADEFIKRNLPGQEFSREALMKELNDQSDKLVSLSERIKPYREEIEKLERVRFFIRKLIPELHGEHPKVSPWKIEENRLSLKEEFTQVMKEAEASLKETKRSNAKNAGKTKTKENTKTAVKKRTGRDER